MAKQIVNGVEYCNEFDPQIYAKIGTSQLETQADNLSDAVNEIKQSLSQLDVEVENFSLGYFLGYVIRMGSLRIISLYNGTDTQTATSADLNPKDYPTQDYRAGSWTQVNSSGTWGTRYLQVSASTHKISTSDTVYRGGFMLVYKV